MSVLASLWVWAELQNSKGLLADSSGTGALDFQDGNIGSTQSLISAYLLNDIRVSSSEQRLLGYLVEIRNQKFWLWKET